jgi:hypothetical protein
MGLVEKAALVSQISPPLDHFLATQLVDEFVSMERRFIQRDWEPTELDGGQFCEILARILYHMDSGNLNRTRDFSDCLTYIENDVNQHAIMPRQDALHIVRVLRTGYKFRSQRGAVHISPTYSPNHMDSKFLIESVRWGMNETLRIFWQGDREAVAKAIRELLQFDVPCIGKFEDILLVQRTDLSAEEEILVLLHYAGESGFSRTELGRHSKALPSTITRVVQKLESPDYRQIVLLSSGTYRLTDLGSKRIREELASKLLLQ